MRVYKFSGRNAAAAAAVVVVVVAVVVSQWQVLHGRLSPSLSPLG